MGAWNKRKTGADYEAVAAQYLDSLGYVVLERNYRTRAGEIDLIARDGHVLCFVEVKYRKNADYGLPAEAVGAAKQQKIRMVSRYYLTTHQLWGQSVRYDVVEILGNQIRVLKGCFA